MYSPAVDVLPTPGAPCSSIMSPFPVSRLISATNLLNFDLLLLTLSSDQIKVIIILNLSGWGLAFLFFVLEVRINETHHYILVLPSEFQSIEIVTMFDNLPETI